MGLAVAVAVVVGEEVIILLDLGTLLDVGHAVVILLFVELLLELCKRIFSAFVFTLRIDVHLVVVALFLQEWRILVVSLRFD